MVVIGIDAHKRTHTAVVVDANGRQLGSRTCGSTSKDHLSLLRWAAGHDEQRIWAIEDASSSDASPTPFTKRYALTSSPANQPSLDRGAIYGPRSKAWDARYRHQQRTPEPDTEAADSVECRVPGDA
jgi:hypothetical protein